MEWKNQLTKTPVLIFFILLGTIGVGTASALITITLDGDTIVTGDLTGSNDVFVGNDLYLGDSEGTHDIRFFEDGNPNGERFQWDDGNDQFEFSDDAAVFGDFQVQGDTEVIGSIISHMPGNLNSGNLVIERPSGPTSENAQFVLSHRSTNQDLWLYGYNGTTFKNFVGFDFPNHKVTFPSWGDTFVVDTANDKVGIGTGSPSSELDVVGDIAVSGNLAAAGTIECTNCILGFYTVSEVFAGTGGFFGIAAVCDGGDIVTGGGYFGPTGSEPPFRSSPPGQISWSAQWTTTNLDESYETYARCADYPPAHVP